jgi:multiple sugar transport system substrate-binding protein
MINNVFRYLLFIIVFVIILLTGCADDQNSDIVEFWHFNSEPNQKKALDSVLGLFTDHTGIEVQTTELSWGDGKTKLIAGFNSNTGPDVLELGSDWIAQFASEDIFIEINKTEIDYGRYLPFSMDAATVEGNVYAVPWYVDSRPVMINKSLLERAGIEWNDSITWEEISNADISDLPEGKYLVGINGADQHRLYKKFLPMIWSAGGYLYDGSEYSVSRDESEKALKVYKSLSEIGLVESQKNLDIEFLKGNIGILNSGSWLLGRMERSGKDFDVKLYPATSVNFNNGIAFAGGEYLAVSKQSNKKEKALELVKFLSKGENALLFSKLVPEAGFPADTAYYNHKSLSERKWKDVFAEQLKFSRMTPSDSRWLNVEELIEEAVEKVLYGKEEPQGALSDAQRKIEALK